MAPIEYLLTEISRNGIVLSLSEDGQRVRMNAERPDVLDLFRDAIRQHKSAIIQELKARAQREQRNRFIAELPRESRLSIAGATGRQRRDDPSIDMDAAIQQALRAEIESCGLEWPDESEAGPC